MNVRRQIPVLLTAIAWLHFPVTVHCQTTKDPEVEFSGKIRLILPKVIYAVPGVEMNVYFDNVALVVNPANYVFDATCAKGTQQTERWTYTPATNEAGNYPFTLEVRNDANTVVARAKTTVQVVADGAGKGAQTSLLIIGDSLTAASVYPQHLLDLWKTNNLGQLTLIGSHGPGGAPGENRHEGYGGWTAERFATHYTGATREADYKKRGSPFVYKEGDSPPKLDFARYCREFNQGKGPDFATLLLGCNDTFSATDDTLEERIDTMFRHYDTLLEMIHSVRKDTRIGALLLVPPAASQDAFGANYNSGQTRWQYKRNQHRVVERMIAHYGGREAENVFLVPAFVNLDCVRNYPQRTAPANARTAEKVIRLNNGVHPAAEGYRQIGDSIYCWIKSRFASEKR